MARQLQRMLARAAAIGAVLAGGALAFVLAALTLVVGLLIGLFVTAAAWFGARSPRPGAGGVFGSPPAARNDEVIDVDMREIGPGEQPDRPAAPLADDKRPEP